jgi:hypothetical protein
MSNKIRKWIKKYFNLYDISDLQIGGHCGFCGKWIDNVITPKSWSVTLCEKCK